MGKISDTNEREWEKGDNRMAIYTTTPSNEGENDREERGKEASRSTREHPQSVWPETPWKDRGVAEPHEAASQVEE